MIAEDERPATLEPVGGTAFDELCRRMHPRLVRSLSLYCGDAALGPDLAQEALAIAWRDWQTVQHVNNPEAWIHRVGMNLAHSWFRRARLAREHSRPTETSARSEPETALAVRAAVAALPRRQRQALVLRYFVDLSITDTAAAMGCAEGTVRALTSQATAALRARLIDVWEVPE